jgi:16S rRNA (guanine966-N2)-methyltransferase
VNIRLISGKFGGRLIQTPDGKITHPMSERVRSSLFNILGDKVKDAEVLDAFAGSGSLGFEALSRGALHVTFVDHDRVASDTLKGNINKLEVNQQTVVLQMDIESWLKNNNGKLYDVIFTDPPYNDMQFSTVSRLAQLLSPNGIMILSYPGRGEVPPEIGIVVVDNRSYGTAGLAFYRKK